MNFKEGYRKEMDGIQKTAGLTEKAIDVAFQMQREETPAVREERTRSRRGGWRMAAAVLAAVCILAGVLQQEMILSFAKSILGRFAVSVDGEQMEFGEIAAVPMDVEGFLADSGTRVVDDSKAEPPYGYYQSFASYEAMNRVTNITLPGEELVEYRQLSVDLTPEYCFGHISGEICTGENVYPINGMYTVEGYTGENWGYGDGKNSKIEKYGYGRGKNAYFVTDADGSRKVYFEEENILFQLFLGDTAEEETVKELLERLGR